MFLSKRAGLFQAPPEMVKRIWEWVLPRYAALVYQNTNDINLKEAAGRDCDFQPEKYQDFETSIPISLEGWKYYDEKFKAAEEWNDIKVIIFSKYEPEYVGKYTDTNNTIDIVLDTQWFNPSFKNYEMLKKSIHRNIEHEVIHLGQYIFKHFKNLELGGIPSKYISDTEYTPEGAHILSENPKPHQLRDIEFYSILNDAKIELQRQLQQWPEDMHDNIFKRYVGIIPSYQIKSVPRQFFEDLKTEPGKWQKAVKELYKTMETKIFISKRAKEKLYEILLRPTENQLEYFLKQKGVSYRPFRDKPQPNLLVEEKQEAYYNGVENAFQYALKELKHLAEKYNFKIINDNMDYTVVDDIIYPAELTIEADSYTISELENHPIIRHVEEKTPTINEVYV